VRPARGRVRALAVTGVFAAALFVGSGTAVSDITPTTPAPTATVPTSTVPTSTNPVSTVTLLPTPKQAKTPVAKPDPVPKAKPKTTPKPRQTYTPPATTPTKTVTVTKPKVAVHKVPVKKITHHAAPKKKIVKPVVTLPVVVLVPPLAVRTARPVVTVPTPAPRPVPAARHGHGRTWIVPVGGALLLFLLVLGLIVASEKGLFKAIGEWRQRRRAAAVAAAVVPVVVGAPVLSLVAPLPEEAAAPEQPDSCRITWWRDAEKSQFYACVWTGSGMVMNLIAESPVFPWLAQDGAPAVVSPEAMIDEDEPPPQSDDAVIAYTELVQLLADLGWEPELTRSDSWFHATFRYVGVDAAAAVSAASA
jgi:hypothetical protein